MVLFFFFLKKINNKKCHCRNYLINKLKKKNFNIINDYDKKYLSFFLFFSLFVFMIIFILIG